jgi:hypothetical protein
METTHTPGPWMAVPIGTTRQLFSIEANGINLAEVWASERRKMDIQGEANARLISCAPELLRMLRIARTRIQEMAVHLEDANPEQYNKSKFAIDNDLNRIDDEISKATGK